MKTDGTLWILEPYTYNKRRPDLHTFIPQRLDKDTDWDGISAGERGTFFCKTNGQVFTTFGISLGNNVEALGFGNGLSIYQAPYLEKANYKSVAQVASYSERPLLVGVCDDGTFREIAQAAELPILKATRQKLSIYNSLDWRWVRQNLQIGQETNWLAMAQVAGYVITLKADGTLWKWDFSSLGGLARSGVPAVAAASPIRFGTQADWVAIGECMGGMVALAADGSLCMWRFEPPHGWFYSNWWDEGGLLRVSRRPVSLGNVFDQPIQGDDK